MTRQCVFRILNVIAVLTIVGCTEGPCPIECNNIPDAGMKFSGKWKWDYSVVTSELLPPNPPLEHKDTIISDSIGVEVTLHIEADGGYLYKVGSDSAFGCMNVVQAERRQPSEYSCRDYFTADIYESEIEFRVGYISECTTEDSLLGSGVPYDNEHQWLPVPELPVGHGNEYYSNYFVRIPD